MSATIMTASSVAPIFLTRPLLFLGINSSSIDTINAFLQAFITVAGGDSQQLNIQPSYLPSLSDIVAACNAETVALIKLVFGPIPSVGKPTSAKLTIPVPLALACHYFGIVWNDWYISLGGSRFSLILKPTCVYVVKKSDGCIGVVWTDMADDASPVRSTSPSLSTSDSEDSCSSRPSSRSSNHSSFSFSSRSSGSSQSSIVSSSTPSPKPTPTFTVAVTSPTPTQASFSRSQYLAPIRNLNKIRSSTSTSTTKPTQPAAPTKYLYQGGVSTVLTGGVMLGTAPSRKTAPPVNTPKTAAPIPRAPSGPMASGTWRRTHAHELSRLIC